jgi:hypothetical protein
MSTEKPVLGANVARPDSAVTSVTGLKPVLVRQPVADSAMVTVSAATRLSHVATIVSSMVKVGVSATVRLRSGNKEALRSAIASLNDKTEIVSAALTLRGVQPVK